MQQDRYGLSLATTSAAARDAYVTGFDLLLTMYPGAALAFDRAIAADPGFALAHAGRALERLREGDAPTASAAMAAAEACAAALSPREAAHLGFLGMLVAGRAEAALAALPGHLAEWPRDALVLVNAITPNGLYGSAGLAGRNGIVAELMDALAPHYAEDWWFAAQHGMALSEVGRREAAGPLIAASLAANPANAWAAHARAHLAYESGDPVGARDFLLGWLPRYPRAGALHGHLAWHLALEELELGDVAAAEALYAEAIAPAVHTGPARLKLTDGASYLWRRELAGQPRDAARWQELQGFALAGFPRAGFAFGDLHLALAAVAAGDAAALEALLARIAPLLRDGHYPGGGVVPRLAEGFAAFARGEHDRAIERIAPLLIERERLGGSCAQSDLLEFTLLRAYLAAGRTKEARRLRAARRPGPSGIPVAGVAALH